MYQINSRFIPRTNDCCFLDPINFNIYKLNQSGYEIISKIASKGMIDIMTFESICCREGVNEAEAMSFWTNCIQSKLLIPCD